MTESKKLKREFDCRSLSEETQNTLESASALQHDLKGITNDMNQRILAIIQDHTDQKKPLYDKRHAILRSIPHFWAIAFINHPKLRLLMNNGIEDCFHYMQCIQVVENDVKSGFQILFGFDTNPYFYNNKLVKSYVCENDVFVMRKTVIDWKENMNLCNDCKKSRPGRKRGAPLENFFDWLVRSSSNDVICDIIRDDLWVDPLKYYFASADEENEESESDSEDDDDCDFLDDGDEDYNDGDVSNLSDNDAKTS